MLEHFEPICIASPIQRTGTTLLQRLLCSDPNALIYGESCAGDLNISLSLFLNKQIMLGGPRQGQNNQLQRVLAGQVNAWIPDLQPDSITYVNHFQLKLRQELEFFAAYAANRGRTRWGFKLPSWPVAQLFQLAKLLPKAKIIYINRQLVDCVRSAKLLGFCQTTNDIHQFAQMYIHNSKQALNQLPKAQTLFLQYEDIKEDASKFLQELAQFTGLEKINAEVLNHRINNYGDHYQKVVELSSEEHKLLEPYIQTQNQFFYSKTT